MGPGLYHKKSKMGCLRCRARRVKCDEALPTCGHCRRHSVTCGYGPRNQLGESGESETAPSPMVSILGQLGRFPSPTTSGSSTQELEIPESRSRRLQQLRLFYHYTEKTCYTLRADSTSGLDIWKDAAVQMAFTSDAMLYSLLAISAQHIAHDNTSDSEAQAASLEYLDLALSLHRRDVAELNRENADLAYLTSSLLRVCACAGLQSRPIEPYTLPKQFLLQARGSLDLTRVAVDRGYVHDNPNSIIGKMIARAPYVRYRNLPALFAVANRQPLMHLLYRSPEHIASEPWSGDIQSAYEDTLSYLGAIRSVKSPDTADTPGSQGEHPPDPPLRRLFLFPTMVPELFIQLTMEAKPRALVILAHYFAALAEFEHFWWISNIGLRETRGLLTAVKDFQWETAIVTDLLKSLNPSTEKE